MNSDDRYLNKVNPAEVPKITKPIEYKQESDYIDSQRQNEGESGIEKMIGQVQIDDGKDDLEATFGKDEEKKAMRNTLNAANKSKVTRFENNGRST